MKMRPKIPIIIAARSPFDIGKTSQSGATPCGNKPRTESSLLRLQIPQQPLEGLLVTVMIFPVGEVGDKILPDLPCRILSRISIEGFPIADLLEGDKTDGEKHLA